MLAHSGGKTLILAHSGDPSSFQDDQVDTSTIGTFEPGAFESEVNTEGDFFSGLDLHIAQTGEDLQDDQTAGESSQFLTHYRIANDNAADDERRGKVCSLCNEVTVPSHFIDPKAATEIGIEVGNGMCYPCFNKLQK